MTNPPIKIYRVNTGSCGGCDTEIEAAVANGTELRWAETPGDADVLLLTGPLLSAVRPAFQALRRSVGEHIPLVAIGRCAIDGHPFGRGGLADTPEVIAVLKLDGCPPTPRAITEAIRQALSRSATKRDTRRERR